MSEKQRAPKQGRAAQGGAASRCRPSQANLRPSVPPLRQAASNTTTGREGENKQQSEQAKQHAPHQAALPEERGGDSCRQGGEGPAQWGHIVQRTSVCEETPTAAHTPGPTKPMPAETPRPKEMADTAADRRAKERQERSEQSRGRGTPRQVIWRPQLADVQSV